MRRFLSFFYVLPVFFLTRLALAATDASPTAPQTANPASDVWSTAMVAAASPVKARIGAFNTLLQWMMLGIVVFVAVALVVTIIRFRRARNPVPSTTAHNVPLEIVWTLIPCLILVVIMIFSFPLMYYSDKIEKPDLTLKVTGYQWYWGYSYPDQEIEEYTLYMTPEEHTDTKNEFAALRALPTYQRLLSNYELASGKPGFIVLPVQKNVRVLITANDVIHSWAVPALGVKKDAVPGRLNETWLRIERPGIYYGQCSELCGTLHGFMPIEIRAVDAETFDAWAKQMKTDLPGAMAMVQDRTASYAHAQIKMPRLTLRYLWDNILHMGQSGNVTYQQ